MPELSNMIDVQQLQQNTGGDPRLIAHLVKVFQRVLPQIENELAAADEADDIVGIIRTARRLETILPLIAARCVSTAERIALGAGLQDHRLLVIQLRHEVQQLVPLLGRLPKEAVL